MVVRFRPARVEDCFYFEEHMRKADKIEASCVSTKMYADVLLDCIYHSQESHVAYFVGGKPFAMFGVAKSSALGDAVPWCVATDEMMQCKKFFFKTAKQLVESWLDSYGRLWNVVHEENKLAIFFLKRLGFSFGEKAWGINESVMIEFYKERGDS